MKRCVTTSVVLVLVVFGMLFGAAPALAIWTGASSGTSYSAGGVGDYDNTGNWASGAIDDSFSAFTLTGDLTVTLDNVRTTGAGGLNLDYAGAYNLTLAGVTSSRVLTLGGNVSADTVDGGRTITIGGGSGVSLSLGTANRDVTVGAGDTLIIANASQNTTGGITKKGAGLLQLNAANAWTGLTQVDAGELRWGIANAIAGNLTVNNGGTVNIQTFSDSVGTVTIANGGNITGTTGILTTGGGGLVSNGGGTISGFTTGDVTTGALKLALNAGITYNAGAGSTTLQIDRLRLDDTAGTSVFDIADGEAAVDFELTTIIVDGNSVKTATKTGAGVMQFSGAAGPVHKNGSLNFRIDNGTLLLNKADGVLSIANAFTSYTIGDGSGAAGSAILKYTTAGGW